MSATDESLLLDPAERINPAKLLSIVAAERMRRSLRLFMQRAWPQIYPQKLLWSWHLDALADHLAYVTMGDIRNLMVSYPPRHTKSSTASVMWQVWNWLWLPNDQYITASVDERLALRDSIASRRLIESGWYQSFYGGRYYLLPDENQSRMYRNSENGFRMVMSTHGRVVGDGGTVQIGDDFSDPNKVESDQVRQSTNSWYDNAFRNRVNNPNSAKRLLIGQRTHSRDVYGHVLERERERWVVLSLPLEFDPKRKCITYPNDGRGVKKGAKPIFEDPRQIEGELLHPQHFSAETAATEKNIISKRAWAAQYQQQPEGEGGLILKSAWWRQWVYPEGHPSAGKVRPMPNFFEVIQVWDTAFEEDEEADYTAMTEWGLFEFNESERDPKTGRLREGRSRTCAMLLDMLCERMEFPELREEMIARDKARGPTWILIEKKASGHSLIHEGRRKGLPIKAIKIPSGADLMSRVKAASLMLEKGCIWYVPRIWSNRVIDSAAKFPNGDHDDIESTLSMAWQYMRRYYDLTLPDDEPAEEISPFSWQRRKTY